MAITTHQNLSAGNWVNINRLSNNPAQDNFYASIFTLLLVFFSLLVGFMLCALTFNYFSVLNGVSVECQKLSGNYFGFGFGFTTV